MQQAHQSGVPLLRLLFVDNAQTDYGLLLRFIELGGYRLQSTRVETALQMREALFNAAWDAVISELDLPGFPLPEVLMVLRESALDTPLVVVTGTGDEDAAVDAMIAGADDYVSKSRLARLVPALKRSLLAAAARRRERADQSRLRLLQFHLDHANEVKTVARDLHNTFGELMTELETDFAWFSLNVAGDAHRIRVQNMQQALDRALARAQRSMGTLRPPLLELGIVNALQALAQSILRRHGIVCEFSSNRATIALDEASFFAMYHVCQESLVLLARQKHTKSIRIEVYAQSESVTLEVADDGMLAEDDGFSVAAFRDLREAVETLGGLLEISRDPRHGTSIMVSLPVTEGV